MKRRRIKKEVYIFGIILILVIVFAVFGIRYLIYRGTDEYKLKKIGYQKDEIAIIEKLEKEEVSKVLQMEYNISIPKLLKEKYCKFR